MNSEIILIGNICIYVLTLAYSIKYKKSKLGIYLLLLFTFVAFFGYMFFIQPGFWNTVHGSYMTIPPFVFLYFCLMLLIKPILEWKGNKAGLKLYKWNHCNISLYLNIAICIYLFLILINFPDLLHNMTGDLAANRENVYGETGRNIRTHFLINNALYINIDIFMRSTSYYSIILTGYLILFCQKYKKKATILLLVNFIYQLETGIILVSRGPILCLILSCIFIYLIYYKYIGKKIKKWVIIGAAGLAPIAIAYSTMISDARFDNDIAQLFLYKYLGESMINFNGLMFDHLKGTTDGTAYFTFFIRPFHYLKYLNGYAKWEYIESLTGVSGQYFYTVIGGLLFEFGKCLTVIICIGCFYLQKTKYAIKNNVVTLPQLFILIFFAKQLIFGVWLFNLQGPDGGYEIIGLFMFCWAFKNKIFVR